MPRPKKNEVESSYRGAVEKFEGYLLLNWETGKIRAVKSEYPVRKKKPFELAIKYEFDVKIPNFPEPSVSMEVEMSEGEYVEGMMEKL